MNLIEEIQSFVQNDAKLLLYIGGCYHPIGARSFLPSVLLRGASPIKEPKKSSPDFKSFGENFLLDQF